MKEAIKAWFREKKGFDHVALLFSNRENEQVELDIESLFEECMADLRLKIEAEVIEDMASKVCPVSGYVIRSEQARGDLIDWAKTLRAVPPTK